MAHPDNAYRHPRAGSFGRAVAALANHAGLARVRRAVFSRLPFLRLASDVRDVAYLTWLVPVDACRAFVPPGVALWQRDGLTPFTVLTYRHSHFGPTLLRWFRRLFPSPLQSNWRLYLEHAPAGAPSGRTVLFLKNLISSLPYALATRLFSDALPTHLPATFAHRRAGDRIESRIEPGDGSAPAFAATVRCEDARVLPEPFSRLFGDWSQAIDFLVLQDAAVAPVPGSDRLAFAQIDLPVDLARVRPATIEGATQCALLAQLPPAAGPLCFVVEDVRFEAVSERVLPAVDTGA